MGYDDRELGSYLGRLIGSNSKGKCVTVTRQFCCVLISLLWIAAAPIASASDLPDIGDTSGTLLSPEQERQIGAAAMRDLRRSLAIIDDPIINEYIQSLGYRLVANSDSQQRQFTFFVVNDPSVNAFAAPGGFIGLNTGLILITESESELASVLAHEIAHITQNHFLRAMESASRMNLPATAALIAAIILGQDSQALGGAVIGGYIQQRINFTRANEQEADRVGIDVLMRSNFDPRSMPLFFSRLQQSGRYSSTAVPEFLSTHPVTTARIADAASRAEQLPKTTTLESESYRLVQASLRVKAEKDPAQSVRYFSAQLKNERYKNDVATQYGYAMALSGAGQHKPARQVLTKLLQKTPDNLVLLVAKAEIELAARRYQDASDVLAGALKIYPDNHALTLLYANVLLQNKQAASATTLLQRHAKLHVAEPSVYKLLAQAEEESGHPLNAHQAMAEFHYHNGELREAIDQLTTALTLIRDNNFYQQSRVKARLDQFKEEALLQSKQTGEPPPSK